MLKLHFRDGRQAPVWLVEECFTIGRDRRNRLVIDDPSVSDFHAEIRQQGGHYLLDDCAGSSGTFVNQRRVERGYQLRADDCLRLGGVELQLLEPSKPAVRPDATVRWFLQVASGEQLGKKFHLPPGSASLGRSPKSELCFSDPELSRRHCEFFLKDDVLEVKDLASANGVYVNQKRVSSAQLRPGDEVRLGGLSLLVIGPQLREAAAPAEDEADDGDVTRFVKAVELPPLERPQSGSARPTANPLHAPPASAAQAATVTARGGPGALQVGLIGLGVLLLGISGALLLF